MQAKASGKMSVVDHGVDTWRLLFRADAEGPEARSIIEHPTAQQKDGGVILADKVRDHVVGWDPLHSVIFVEGHPRPGGLAKARELVPAFGGVLDGLDDTNVSVPKGVSRSMLSRVRHDPGRNGERTRAGWTSYWTPGFAGVSRLDVTAEWETPSQVYGLEWMKVLHAIQFATGRVRPYGQHNMWETIYIAGKGRSKNKVLGRIYDKGLESGSAPRGRLLRAEDQRRFNPERRRVVEEIDAQFLCAKFAHRVRPFTSVSREQGEVTVGDPQAIGQVIQDKIDAGELDALEGERLAGCVMLDYIAGGGRRANRITLWRRHKRLRELGIAIDAESTGGTTTMAVHEPFEMLAQPALWD